MLRNGLQDLVVHRSTDSSPFSSSRSGEYSTPPVCNMMDELRELRNILSTLADQAGLDEKSLYPSPAALDSPRQKSQLGDGSDSPRECSSEHTVMQSFKASMRRTVEDFKQQLLDITAEKRSLEKRVEAYGQRFRDQARTIDALTKEEEVRETVSSPQPPSCPSPGDQEDIEALGERVKDLEQDNSRLYRLKHAYEIRLEEA
ncbi:unnamed protein product [Vitrella brassicaformis CCMP3155]|uniref:Uncharacterized protein n=1 Tax=Vitrella brassicaformis (strain CCMP3155) TaxID=1169540 RepID=A0A0G4EDW1_VITBC|nr:unnamed protein product [Vitrella brassicaformis CCMP3155]|eukprot:CEL94150.1 unnamed protein product [Vitrella brassicaformis CCMP3155]